MLTCGSPMPSWCETTLRFWAFGWFLVGATMLRLKLAKKGATGFWWWTKDIRITGRDLLPMALCFFAALPAAIVLIVLALR